MNNTENWKSQFFTIWTGQAISTITSSILQMVLIWHLTAQSGSATVLSIASLLGFLPQALLGPFIGVWIDRLSRKKVLVIADIFIASVAAALAIISMLKPMPIWIVLIALFLRSIGTAFHMPAMNAVTPLIVPKDQLTKSSGYTQMLQSASLIISPAIAALLYTRMPIAWIIMLDILGAIIASITVGVVKIPEIKDIKKVISVNQGFFNEFKNGYIELCKHRGLLTITWLGTIYMFAFMPINALFPLMSMHYFNGTEWNSSISEISFAIGMLFGGIIIGISGGMKKRTHLMALSVLMMGIALIVSGSLPPTMFPIFAVSCSIMGISASFYGSSSMPLYQEKIAPEYLGRVLSLTNSLSSLSMPLGLLLSGFFADKIGVHNFFLFAGIMITILSFLFALLPSVRHLENKQDLREVILE